MLKSILIIINLQISLFALSQYIVVISDNFDSSKAILRCFEGEKEVFETIDVNLGKKGLGWGVSNFIINHHKNEVKKQEGDKKAPIGIFKLYSTFGYASTVTTKMPYIQATRDLICVDDSNSKDYNTIIKMPQIKPNSFEYMRREDSQYELGITVGHNTIQKKNAGSCIFIHVQKHLNAPTAGCTSMAYEDLEKIVKWLDIKKNPILIQVPKKYLGEVKKLYPELPLD